MLEEQINKDYIQAMKDRNTLKSSTLSFLRAQVKNVRIELKNDQVSDEEVIKVIKKQIKQRQDSITQYQQGGRQDLADKETAELIVLKSYLPEEMGEAQLKAIIQATIQEVGAKSANDMGKVMKALLSKVAGKADNKLVSELVKKSLSEV